MVVRMNIQGNMLDHDIQEELSVNQCTIEKFCAEVFLLSAYRLLGTNDIRLNVPMHNKRECLGTCPQEMKSA
jgi:hypothetical protein